MASERPEYNDKIISMQALAPVASFIDIKSPYILYIATWLEAVDVSKCSTLRGINLIEMVLFFHSVLEHDVWSK